MSLADGTVTEGSDNMYLEGETVEEGLKDYIKSTLTNISSKQNDSGKFFFTVSSGTIGVIAALKAISTPKSFGVSLLMSALCLIASIVLSLIMVLPQLSNEKTKGKTDLLDLYRKEIGVIRLKSYWWFGLWFVGTAIGMIAIFE